MKRKANKRTAPAASRARAPLHLSDVLLALDHRESFWRLDCAIFARRFGGFRG